MSHSDCSQGQVAGGLVSSQQMTPGRERRMIWQGVLEWNEKAKDLTEPQRLARHVECRVSVSSSSDSEPKIKTVWWPHKLMMQLMPMQIIRNIDAAYLKNSESLLFHPIACKALEELTKVMSTGVSGCVYFTSVPCPTPSDIKVLILQYFGRREKFIGCIPDDQPGFLDSLRKAIQRQKTIEAVIGQSQVFAGETVSNNTPKVTPSVTGTLYNEILMSPGNSTEIDSGGCMDLEQYGVSATGPQEGEKRPVKVIETKLGTFESSHDIMGGGISESQHGVKRGIKRASSHGNEGMVQEEKKGLSPRERNLFKIQKLCQALETAKRQVANIHRELKSAEDEEKQYKQQDRASKYSARRTKLVRHPGGIAWLVVDPESE